MDKLRGILRGPEALTGEVREPERFTASALSPAAPVRDGLYVDKDFKGVASGWYENNVKGDIPTGTYRGGVQVDIVYERIIYAQPRSFVQFKYAAYAGKQVLWQDAEGTIPVTTVGQRIGRSDCLVNPDYWVHQFLPDQRPYWNGSSADFIADELDFIQWNTHDATDFLVDPAPHSWFGKASTLGSDRSTYTLISTSQYGAGQPGVMGRYVNDGFVYYMRKQAGQAVGGEPYAYENGAMDGGMHVMSFQMNLFKTLDLDGYRRSGNHNLTDWDSGLTPQYPAVLGAQINLSNGRASTALNGSIEYMALFDRFVSSTESGAI